ncbi:hypothetical protein AS850_02955 [Frondihabitans sp. 762G35]|uniref:hypothetical protein n=1 Tax=Frondihabitans sp. 762G35 TaxID=1446794 RepID=UPI000D20984B|nr:hypothetical protein [Frondihabitans sp. 762G35]ARC56032.1 hypothetical protein AS850_02955 [Frondihabitans sp. 762G35]
MSTTARKARKRAGIKFDRTPKIGTPLSERSQPDEMYYANWRRRWGTGSQSLPQPDQHKPLMERIAAAASGLLRAR